MVNIFVLIKILGYIGNNENWLIVQNNNAGMMKLS